MPVNEIASSVLRNQFAISREPVAGYAKNRQFGEWFVGYDQKYSTTTILDKMGEAVGAFLGTVIDIGSNEFQPSSINIPWTRGSDQKLLEECLYEKTGSWIAIVVTAEIQSLYLDACGSLPLVYFPDRTQAGSSANALLGEIEYFEDLYEEAKAETWFKADWYHTAGLTAHRSLRRLLPNHRLDLRNWAIERIWPIEPFPMSEIAQVVDEIANTSRATIAASFRERRVLVPLTAGNETRALLSLVKKWKSNALFFTGTFPGAIVDVGVARRLAKRFQLPHVVTRVEARSPEDVQLWRRRTGHCVGGAIGFSGMERKRISDVQLELSGAAGEVGRGFLWSAGDAASDLLTSEVLLARLKLPRIDRFVIAVDNWLKSVAQFDAFTVMDLAYIELKMACWAGPQATGAETGIPQIWPFSSRRCFAAMMSAPKQVRLEQSLFKRIVENEWPELLELPINRGTIWENARRLIYRASSPRRIWSKIQKSLAKLKSTEKIA